MTYKFVPHTADIRITFRATSWHELLGDGLRLVRELVVGSGEVEPNQQRQIAFAAPDHAEAFLTYLRELFLLFESEQLVPCSLEIDESTSELEFQVTVFGDTFDSERHETQPEVKAVTRHGLRVEKQDGGWEAEVILDV